MFVLQSMVPMFSSGFFCMYTGIPLLSVAKSLVSTSQKSGVTGKKGLQTRLKNLSEEGGTTPKREVDKT